MIISSRLKDKIFPKAYFKPRGLMMADGKVSTGHMVGCLVNYFQSGKGLANEQRWLPCFSLNGESLAIREQRPRWGCSVIIRPIQTVADQRCYNFEPKFPFKRNVFDGQTMSAISKIGVISFWPRVNGHRNQYSIRAPNRRRIDHIVSRIDHNYGLGWSSSMPTATSSARPRFPKRRTIRHFSVMEAEFSYQLCCDPKHGSTSTLPHHLSARSHSKGWKRRLEGLVPQEGEDCFSLRRPRRYQRTHLLRCVREAASIAQSSLSDSWMYLASEWEYPRNLL